MKTYTKHYVTFYSPGTFFTEQTKKEIAEWDVLTAVRMAADVTERYGAKPFGFRFSTVIGHKPISDGKGGTLEVEEKQVEESPGIFYLTGTVKRFDDIPDTEEFRILRDNMRCNRWPHVIENANSYRFTSHFDKSDCIVDLQGAVILRGIEPALHDYAIAKQAEWNEQRTAPEVTHG